MCVNIFIEIVFLFKSPFCEVRGGVRVCEVGVGEERVCEVCTEEESECVRL